MPSWFSDICAVCQLKDTLIDFQIAITSLASGPQRDPRTGLRKAIERHR